ncbi:MAG: hypothetical protein WHT06_16720 [Desulfobacterales bacterium]
MEIDDHRRSPARGHQKRDGRPGFPISRQGGEQMKIFSGFAHNIFNLRARYLPISPQKGRKFFIEKFQIIKPLFAGFADLAGWPPGSDEVSSSSFL